MTFTIDEDDSVDNIDSILSDMKEYNIEKGIRNVEDTQINIISELTKEELLTSKPVDKPEPAAEPVTASKPEKKSLFQSFFGVSDEEIDNYEEDDDDLNAEVKPVKESAEKYSEEEIEQTNNSIMKAIADMKPIEDGELLYDEAPTAEIPVVKGYAQPMTRKQEDQEHINNLTMQIEKERAAREEMFERTQQLKLQVSEYENDLNEVSNNMSRTNRILNVILTLLIIALFVILFIMGFFFAKERGLI